MLIDYDNGAAGIFWTSFAMVGKSCCMKVRIYGDKGGMEWNAHDFMELRVDIAGQPTQIWSANYDYCDPQARKPAASPRGCRRPSTPCSPTSTGVTVPICCPGRRAKTDAALPVRPTSR